ncbi:MAG: acyl-CoA dehydrogenase family protein [Gammaproteobacteria bacterium]|nr:acyl-CoA dehydrogenase family protein [Gammaproteobacteria bacterium]
MDHHLSDDQSAIKNLAEKFTAEKITQQASAWDEQHIFPRETISEAADLGFGAIYISEANGGIGLGRIEAALIIEAMAYGCPSTAAFISIHNMATWIIENFGSSHIHKRFLPKLISMEHLASYCLTEPDSGSDAAALRTRAERDGDHYVLNGTKSFISGAGENEIYVCMVRTGEDRHAGVSCLVIEKDTPGVTFGAKERKMGWHSQPTAMVNFSDARVPVENLVGKEGDGFKIAMAGLDGGRLNIAACSLGGAQRCLDEAISYTKQRRQFGKTIADFQNTQFVIADMVTQLSAARALTYIAAQKVTEGALDKTPFSAMAKLLATESGSRIANDALQLHGGYGYLMDYPVERFVRDLRVHQILEGTSEIMRMVIGRSALR